MLRPFDQPPRSDVENEHDPNFYGGIYYDPENCRHWAEYQRAEYEVIGSPWIVIEQGADDLPPAQYGPFAGLTEAKTKAREIVGFRID